jgi:hypothetical protein
MPDWFKWLRKARREIMPYETLRGSILANESLERVAGYAKPGIGNGSPWALFAAAYADLDNNPADAQAHLQKILAIPDLESRVYLQAWHCLRGLGVIPSAEASSEVKGIVIEVGLENGIDVVAAYSDHSARYFNYSGATIIWDTTDPQMDHYIDDLLNAANAIAIVTGPLDLPHPPLPRESMVIISILTYGGIHIGLGPMDSISIDPIGGLAIQNGIALMKALIERAGDT